MKLALLLTLLPAVLAFKDTIPVVAWSTHPTFQLASTAAHGPALLLDDDICAHEAVVIIDQPGLQATDLRSLPPTSHIARSLSSSVSARQLPYVPVAHSGDLFSLAESISQLCASRLVSYVPGVYLDRTEKSVLVITFPELSNEGHVRKESMLQHDQLLAETMAGFPFETHLMVFSSSSAPSHYKRQSESAVPVLQFTSFDSSKGGILARYQLLTPGLITTLLVVLFILLPIMYFGISALASIQSPVRMDTPKAFSATDKKRQ